MRIDTGVVVRLGSEFGPEPRARRLPIRSIWRTVCSAYGGNAFVLLSLCGCSVTPVNESERRVETAASAVPSRVIAGPSSSAAPSRDEPTDDDSPSPKQAESCEHRWREIQAQPADAGAPEFGGNRALLLARAKAEPVIFFRTPQWGPASSATVESYRRHLQNATHHWDALAFQLRRFVARPDIGRQVLLRDGYLYAEHPHMAYAFEQLVKPEHLFDGPRIWIQRGDRTYWARKTPDGEYVYEDSPADQPQVVNLLHLDRVGEGDPTPALHADVRALRRRLRFDRLRVVHATADSVLAEVLYGSKTVRVVLQRRGAELVVRCGVGEHGSSTRSRNARRQEALERLQHAMHAQVVDAPPFDEPRDETGIEDGVLRPLWQEAYAKGRRYFFVRDEVYDVFNSRGQPVPPQVCVDFLTDTLERASGSWWNADGQSRTRQVGALDLSELDALRRRRVADLVRFARSKPEWFDVYETPPSERVPIGHRERFFSELIDDPGALATGDIVVVRGYTEDDETRMHSHSFFIYEVDPITGVPIAVVGNAGMPHIWSLEGESRREPERSIQYRLRPREALLERVLKGQFVAPPVPAPLVEEAL